MLTVYLATIPTELLIDFLLPLSHQFPEISGYKNVGIGRFLVQMGIRDL